LLLSWLTLYVEWQNRHGVGFDLTLQNIYQLYHIGC